MTTRGMPEALEYHHVLIDADVVVFFSSCKTTPHAPEVRAPAKGALLGRDTHAHTRSRFPTYQLFDSLVPETLERQLKRNPEN